MPVAVTVNEVAPASGMARQSTSYKGFAAGVATANLPLVESAGADAWSTGEGIMNTGSTATTVTITYYDTSTGAQIGTPAQQALQPNAFWGAYRLSAGLPLGQRTTAAVTTATGGQGAINLQRIERFEFHELRGPVVDPPRATRTLSPGAASAATSETGPIVGGR